MKRPPEFVKTDKLFPCPFCGSSSELLAMPAGQDGCKVMRGPCFQARCSNKKKCGARMTSFESRKWTIDKWNNRT